MKMESLMSIGLILLFIGFILIIISSFSSSIKGQTEVKSAGLIFIGPIPIGWASDKKMFYILIALAITTFIIFYILTKR